MNRHLLLLLLPAVVFSCSVKEETEAPRTSSVTPSEQQFETGRIRIKFKEPLTQTKADNIDLSALGDYTLVRTFPPAGKWEPRHHAAGLDRWYDVVFDNSVPLTKASDAAASLKEVEIVERIPLVRPLQVTYPFNDPRLPEQWHYINPGGQSQWSEGCDINAINAWKIETGKPEVIVAVNDGGVDYQHEDLVANMWVNEAELNGLPGEDDDNNGYADDVNGYSFITYDGKVAIGKIYPHDHGTHVAGTIGAVNNNGIGVSGVAGGNGTPNSGIRIMTTPTLDGQHGSLTPASFAYAADNGAVLINCSWGYVQNENPTPVAVSEAIDYFNTYAGFDEHGVQTGPMAGGLVIFAAGNDGREIEHPAMDDNVFAVAALSANYVRSYFTSYGDWIDICAPGGDANRKTYVLSTLPDNKYGNMQGSSMAAPHVTGVAALIVSHYGVGRKGFTRDDLIYLLQSTANKKALDENGSFATKLGAGLVDAYAALLAGDDFVPLPVSDLSVTSSSNKLSFTWTIPGSTEVGPPAKFNIFYSKSSIASLDPANLPESVYKEQVSTYGRGTGEAMAHDITGLEFNTKYYVRIQSESIKGNTSALSGEITVTTGSNTAPVISPVNSAPYKPVIDNTVTLESSEKATIAFDVSDPDGHTITYVVNELKGMTAGFDAAPGSSGPVSKGLLFINFDARKLEENKTYPCSVGISDSYTQTVYNYNLVIKANNAPKAIGSIDDTIYEGTSAAESKYTLSDFFTDADGETLTYSVASSTTSLIVKTSIENGVLTVTPNSLGITTLTITAKDARDAQASLAFRVLVRNSAEAVEAYPNPVKDYLTVRAGKTGEVSFTVYSSLGAKVMEKTIAVSPFDPAMVDLSVLKAGIYKAVFVTSDETVEKTIVKL